MLSVHQQSPALFDRTKAKMNRIVLFALLVTVSVAAALVDDHDFYYKSSPKKVVYVENTKPSYEIVKSEPEYKKTVYEYREPEEKKVLVKVVKQEDRKYLIRPSYEPKKDVVVKIVDRKL